MSDQSGPTASGPQPAVGVPHPGPRALEPEGGPWNRVSGKYVIVDVTSTLVAGIVIAAAVGFIAYAASNGGLVAWILPGAVLAVTIGVAAFSWRRVRAIGYRERRDDLLVRRGIMFRRFVAVPYGRMQLVDVTQGPIDRALGLSQLKLVTAASSSNVAIPGLVQADADALRDRLVELAESRRAGL